MIGQFVDSTIVALRIRIKSGYSDPSKSKFLETVLSLLKLAPSFLASSLDEVQRSGEINQTCASTECFEYVSLYVFFVTFILKFYWFLSTLPLWLFTIQ